MKMQFLTAAGAVLLPGLLLVSAPGPLAAQQASLETTGESASECAFIRTVNDWRPLDSTHLVVWDPDSDNVYHVTLGTPIARLRWYDSLAFIDGNGDGRHCAFGMDEILTTRAGVPETATISGMTRLEDTDLIALGKRYGVELRPKSDS